jgi:hypothetical protein
VDSRCLGARIEERHTPTTRACSGVPCIVGVVGVHLVHYTHYTHLLWRTLHGSAGVSRASPHTHFLRTRLARLLLSLTFAHTFAQCNFILIDEADKHTRAHTRARTHARAHARTHIQCNYIVLDEADRMIDMGFEPQVQILE